MYLSRIRLKNDVRGSKLVEYLDRYWQDDSYATHQLIWKFFPASAKQRAFIYRSDKRPDSPGPQFMVVSEERPEPREPKDEAFWQIDQKEYAPKIRAGDRYEFQLRINPTFTAARGKQSPRAEKLVQKREDILLAPRRELPEGDRAEWYQDNLHSKGVEWLDRRAEAAGFVIPSDDTRLEEEDDLTSDILAIEKAVRVDSHGQQKFFKNRNGNPLVISTMDFTGTLEVTNPEKFRDALFKGIGHAKAFGCGLMLIRRPKA
jgi:CRISPR system Cascade subunit CasE